MRTNFRIYGTVALVVLSFCLKIEAQLRNDFFNDATQQFQPQANVVINAVNPSVCGLNFPILDNSCTASHRYDILISGITANQLGVNVVLDEVRIIIAHTWDNDLDITLESPNNKVIELSTDNGGGADNYGDPSDITCSNYTAFTMSGCQLITAGIAPFIGSYVPEGDFDIFHDGSDPNGTWTLQMCDDASSDIGALKFVELVFSEVVCDVTSNLVIESFDSTSVDLSWSSDDCINTIIEYGSPGFTPGNGASAGGGMVVVVPCPVSQPFILDNLIPLTEYEIYVRTECPSGGFTKNSCSVSFKTDCTTPLMTLSENFNAQSTCGTNCSSACNITGLWSNSSEDDFDWLVDAGGTTSANTGPSDDVTGGGNYIYIETSGANCQDGNRADLISNCLLIGAASESCHLSFYYHMYGASIGAMNLDISTDEGLNWINLWSLNGNQGDSWEKVFVDLSAYDNEIARLRFSGFGGDGFNGDLAIDNIQLYGSVAIGNPAFTYFLDNDNDGFGNINSPLTACSGTPPANYVDNADDCNDNNNLIHPNALEIPCNSIDENCNGMADDGILPDPVIANTDACFGVAAILTGSGNLYWYDEAVGGNLLFSGNAFETEILTENTVYYVIDSSGISCKSERIAVSVSVHPNPDIVTSDMPIICAGQNFDLGLVNVVDYNNSGGNLTFHSGTPANISNELTNPVVAPLTTQAYYILSTTSFGCTDELEVVVLVNSTPDVSIQPADTSRICKNGSKILTAFYGGGGSPPFDYEWSNGSVNTITAIPAGPAGTVQTVWISISDQNGCSSADSVFIETIESITTAANSSSAVTTCGGTDGMIIITPLDGVPPYEISWSGPVSGMASGVVGSFNIQNLVQGSYSVHISDSNPFGLNCQMTIPIIVVNGPSATIDPNIIITNASCVGQPDGAINISVSGNAPSFLWSNSATTEDISGVPAGFYSVTITDGICTNVISDIEIEEPDTFDFSATISSASCFGFDDGAIEVNAFGGTPPYVINWNNGATGNQNTDLVAGDYFFSLTDANGCVFISNLITVAQPEPIEFDIAGITSPSCYGETNGSLDIWVLGGTQPYEFLWSNGDITEDIQQISAGDYQVTITDAHGCTYESTTITVNEPDLLSFIITTLQPPTCNNLTDGLIDVDISGGTPPYQFNWSNGANTEVINNLGEGIYNLTLTDSNNCELKISNLQLIAPSVITIDADFIQNSFCEGVADGVIEVSISGGTSPYFYNWNNGASIEDLNNIEAGDYQLTVTDFNGCTVESLVFSITENNSFEANPDVINDVSCYSNSNGSIYISMSGGLFPFSFNWNNGDQTEDIENLPPGNYFATITDANGCISYTDTFFISEPEPLFVDVISVESPNCNGFENGSIEVQVTGGTGNYLYSWNNGASTEDLSNVPSGLYQLTVLDGNNCVASSEIIEIAEPEIIAISLDSIVNVGCLGVDEGSIEIAVSGGVAPYIFEWSTGDTTQNLFGITAGYYSLSVTDDNGCMAFLSSLEVEQLNDGLLIEPDMVDHVSCHNASDGSISILMTGGTPPFQYNWSNGVVTSVNSNLQGGFYNVTVTDANGCVGISPFIEVAEPDELQYFLSGFGNNDCFGLNNGFLNLEVLGGTEPYGFLWSNGDTTQNIANLSEGIYSAIITDANGCSLETNSFPIQGPDSNISVSVLSQTNVLCYGFQNGSVTLTVSGGVAPYSFSWNTGANTATINQLSGGIFTCEVSDANDCVTEEIIVEILEPESALTIDSVSVTDIFYCNDSTGSIALFLSGGTPGYLYQWNNGEDNSVIENLQQGFYECTITDENGCFLNTDFYYVDSPPDDVFLSTSSTPETLGASDGTATVVAEGGTPPYFYLWDDNTGSQTGPTATDLSAGIYEVTVTDARGCTSKASVEVEFITESRLIDLVESIQLFPNPTNSSSKLEIHFSRQVNVKIEVYSILGQMVFSVEKNDNEVNENINFSNHVAGVYLLKVAIDGEQSFIQKIVFTP